MTKLEFLRRHHAGETPHGRTTLLDHLTGVRDVLVAWGAREAVADAGLFHSVYGTESFQARTVPLDLRPQVRAVIGDEAEALAYVFGAMEKTTFDAAVLRGSDFGVGDRHTGDRLGLTEPQWRDLCELVVANWLEQIPRIPGGHRNHKAVMFRAIREWLSPAAVAALNQTYGFES